MHSPPSRNGMASSNTYCAVAAASAVSVLVIDWIIAGRRPPTGT